MSDRQDGDVGSPSADTPAPHAQWIGPTQAVPRALGKTLEYHGRATRAEFWWWWIFWNLMAALGFLLGLILTSDPTSAAGLAFLVALALIPTTTAVAVRRLHDTGVHGWLLLLFLLPVLGLVPLIMLMLRSNAGSNHFAPEPAWHGSGYVGEAPAARRGRAVPIAARLGGGADPPASPAIDVAAISSGAGMAQSASGWRGHRKRIGIVLAAAVIAVAVLAGFVAGRFMARDEAATEANPAPGANEFQSAFEIVTALRVAGVDCQVYGGEPIVLSPDLYCAVTGGGYTIFHPAAASDVVNGLCQVSPSFTEPVLWGGAWIIVPRSYQDWGKQPVAFPDLARPEALQRVLGGSLVLFNDIPGASQCPSQP